MNSQVHLEPNRKLPIKKKQKAQTNNLVINERRLVQ